MSEEIKKKEREEKEEVQEEDEEELSGIERWKIKKKK